MKIWALTLALLMPAEALAAGLTYTAPKAWVTSTPATSMRVAEFMLPRAPGDTMDGELVIYYFGGSGGTIDANIERWLGQMQQPDGAPSGPTAKRDTRSVNGLPVTIVDVSGTYVAEVTPGDPERHNRPNFRMIAAVVQTPDGPYFFKLTGPVRTVTVWDTSFDQFLETVKHRP